MVKGGMAGTGALRTPMRQSLAVAATQCGRCYGLRSAPKHETRAECSPSSRGNSRMRTVCLLSLGVAGALFALPAQALTISNTDADSHAITVTVNGDSKELTIEPQAQVDAPCDKGCTVGLD